MNVEIKKGVSKKTGKDYILLEIEITPEYKKVVFLDPAECALVKATYNIGKEHN